MSDHVMTATLEIPNIGRVRPDIVDLMVQAACDGLGTTLARDSGYHPTDEQHELCLRVREATKQSVVAMLECPPQGWCDKALVSRP